MSHTETIRREAVEALDLIPVPVADRVVYTQKGFFTNSIMPSHIEYYERLNADNWDTHQGSE